MRASTVYKIVDQASWEEASGQGVYRGAPIDHADGFIHLSTKGQVMETARRHFAEEEGLLLVAVSVDAIAADLKWEPSRGGDLFPHLYGDLPLEAVRWVKKLPLSPAGHIFPDLDP